MPKNIVHVLSSFKVGGAERLVLDLAQVQCLGGDCVTVFSCTPSQDALYAEFEHLSSDGMLSCGARFRDYHMIWSRLLSDMDAVLHIHSPAALRYLAPMLPLLKLKGVSLVYTRHGVAPLEGKAWGALHTWAKYFIDVVTFVSDVGLEVFYERFGWPRTKLTTISNGVYVPEVDFADDWTSETHIRLGSVGRMVALKAQSHLVHVISEIQREHTEHQIKVHFFGNGPEKNALQVQADQMLNSGTAIFHGMELNREKVYRNFDVLIVCSEQEGLSLAIMEAMARGIPVIATAVGDSPKLVIEGQTGLLYDYADLAALKSKLLDLLSNPIRINTLGSAARQHIRDHFSLEVTNQQYQLVY